MHAIQLDSEGRLHLKAREGVVRAAGDVVVCPLYVGICGTDLQMINGSRHRGTSILGHEGVARIVTGNERLRSDSLVTFSPVSSLDQDLVLGHSTPGLLTQSRLVTRAEIEGGLLVKLPAEIDLVVATLAEPLAAVIYCHHLLGRFMRGGGLLVVGDGAAGQLAAIFASRQGVDVTIVTSRRGPRVARGFCEGVTVRTAAELDDSATRLFDAAVLAVPRGGAAAAMELALQHIHDGACIDLIGGMPSQQVRGIDLSRLEQVRRANACGVPAGGAYERMVCEGREVWFCGHRGIGERHMQSAIDELVLNGHIYRPLVTHIVPFGADLDTPLQKLAAGEREIDGKPCVKLVVDMGGLNVV
jgi:2-epi-valiolone-7-phosphate 1-reductase